MTFQFARRSPQKGKASARALTASRASCCQKKDCARRQASGCPPRPKRHFGDTSLFQGSSRTYSLAVVVVQQTVTSISRPGNLLPNGAMPTRIVKAIGDEPAHPELAQCCSASSAGRGVAWASLDHLVGAGERRTEAMSVVRLWSACRPWASQRRFKAVATTFHSSISSIRSRGQ